MKTHVTEDKHARDKCL